MSKSSPYRVRVRRDESPLEILPRQVVEIVRRTLAAEQVASAEIDIAIVDDATIHRVNREHLQHDYPTDVISFAYNVTEADDEPADDAPLGAGLSIEGELVVSAETAIREAAVYGWAPAEELTLYLVHGLLHLCGHDDLNPEDQRQMRSRERAILQIFGLTPHYDEDEEIA